MISFSEIYDQAINLIDDPIIDRAYFEDSVRFQKLMYPYLKNGIDTFNNPTSVRIALMDQTPPEGQLEMFDGDGGKTYMVTAMPKDGAEFSYRIGTQIDFGASYDSVSKTVTFTREVPIGSKCSFEWYSCGQFNSDFSECSSPRNSKKYIQDTVIGILSRSTVLSWAAKERDFLLDVRSILTDTDFKLHSNANTTRAKVEWYESIRQELDTLVTKFSWNLLSRKYHGGNYYG